ncbi:MAG: DUF5906 domain-containing protein [Methylovulum sp.]|nr:DUF5906 domain-containing protein [Methylovulum sp.]
MSSNYGDVLGQLKAFGLVVEKLITGKMQRCPIEGDKEKRGWYCLHEITTEKRDILFVGSYGVWYGSENNAQKVEINKEALSAEQNAAIRQRLADDKKRADLEQKQRAERAALRADKIWRKLSEVGHCDYLHRKGIQNHGARYSPSGAMAVPLLDTSGRIWGLQFILDKEKQKDLIKKYGRDKHFWPSGVAKKGHFYLIGTPTDIILIAEGYATAATLHEATGFAVAVAFDAGNLEHVCKAIRKRYPKSKQLICADDDAFARCLECAKPVKINASATCPHCGEAHKKKNTGQDYAELAALVVNGRVIAPVFQDDAARFDHYSRNQGKLTDFNDLHALEGLHTVRLQVENALQRFGWSVSAKTRVQNQQGAGDKEQLKPIDSAFELLERFSLVYGKGGMVFDHQEHLLIPLSDMRDLCQSREIHRRWQESPDRAIVRPENVGFDPSGEDPNVTCNLWAGWPTAPKAGNCNALLGVLYHMCSGENNAHELATWVIKWLAYPIQHPGAKMRTTLVLHGPQGTGKNLFFESIMAMYGHYGRVIDQSAVEDKFNDWASRKLFLIADEVVARSDLYHIKNKLKAFITGEWIRVNPKNMAAYEERNHVNLVFLSNERMPVVIEEDDRRHCVIWTPPKKAPEFYRQVAAEIDNGGIAALHDFLLNVDLGDFNEHSKPPMTQAKEDLVALSKDSIQRFCDEWVGKELDGIPNTPALTEDIYSLYRYWCGKQGVKPSPQNRTIDTLSKRPGMSKERKRYLDGSRPTNPKYFLYPPNSLEMNPGNSETGWLGQCVEQFRAAANLYKGKGYD